MEVEENEEDDSSVFCFVCEKDIEKGKSYKECQVCEISHKVHEECFGKCKTNN